MKIKTDYWIKPIPLRNFDWSAVDDDSYDGPGSPIGHGQTREDAIKDLMYQLADRMTDEEYAAAMEEVQRKRDAQEGFDV
jgi:hypothetical protein